jgi:hypothetical protein
VCDFSILRPGRFLSRESQKKKLLNSCGLRVTAANNGNSLNVNVFNSSDIAGRDSRYDPDLGSPNEFCPNKGPGVGKGGKPGSPFPNCVPQNNLLIIQNKNFAEADPNDSPFGGCFIFEFERSVVLLNMGLLDMEEVASISVRKEIDVSSNTMAQLNLPTYLIKMFLALFSFDRYLMKVMLKLQQS